MWGVVDSYPWFGVFRCGCGGVSLCVVHGGGRLTLVCDYWTLGVVGG